MLYRFTPAAIAAVFVALLLSSLCSAAPITPVEVNEFTMRESLVPSLVGIHFLFGLPISGLLTGGTGTVDENGWTLNTTGLLSYSLTGSFTAATNAVSFSGSGVYGTTPFTTNGAGTYLPGSEAIEFTALSAYIDDPVPVVLAAGAAVVGIVAGGITIYRFFFGPSTPPSPPVKKKEVILEQTNVTVVKKRIKTDGATIEIERSGSVPGDIRLSVQSIPEPSPFALLFLGLGTLALARRVRA
ncbi:MAG: PEP-CTERM sorting domain-containing protein [Bryobacterales bacterium]|nr:PEP-CTERM sorting domain-containing protein [Bryobacterales bacterium]